MPASMGVRSPLRWLQPSQAATVFVQEFRPPRDVGMMWSTVVAVREQYPHVRLSRARTPGRDHDGPAEYRHLVTM